MLLRAGTFWGVASSNDRANPALSPSEMLSRSNVAVKVAAFKPKVERQRESHRTAANGARFRPSRRSASLECDKNLSINSRSFWPWHTVGRKLQLRFAPRD